MEYNSRPTNETKNLNIEVPADLINNIKIIAVLQQTSSKKIIIDLLSSAVKEKMKLINIQNLSLSFNNADDTSNNPEEHPDGTFRSNRNMSGKEKQSRKGNKNDTK